MGRWRAYAQLDDPAAAVRWLAATGFACYPWYARDPQLDPIRNDGRFTAFMQDPQRWWEHARAKYSGGASGGR
jgi:hypothetical protein